MATFAECPFVLVAMLNNDEQIFANAQCYAKSRHSDILRQDSPGHGMEGHVWKTSSHSVIKAFYRKECYKTELLCYQRLAQFGVNQIHGLEVPVLEGFDDDLLVIEITFVQPPYLLDFGKAALDTPPSYLLDPKDRKLFESQFRSGFGDRWPEVNAVLHTLQSKYGIYYLDPRPQNICLEDHDPGEDEWMKEPPIDYSQYD